MNIQEHQELNSDRVSTEIDNLRANGAIVFIDPSVDDYSSLMAGVVSGVEVVLLDSMRDGVTQITERLRSRPDFASIHIVSHGSPGCLYLGNSQLSLDTLDGYASDLQTWLSPSLLLYGCNVAAGDAGAEFVEKLHCLTGAEIAASASRVGNPAKGGIWQLECHTGQMDADLAFSPELMQTYAGVFMVSFNDFTGSSFGVGDSPNSIAQGDFDGDGDVDLVTANFDSNNVSVLLNDGSGNFDSATNFAVTGKASSVAVGYFDEDGDDEDGDLDLVVANFDLDSETSDTVSVLLGNGDGSFSPATDFQTGGSTALTVAVADFDGDNNQDLVVGSFDGTVSVLSGNGKGGFTLTSELTVPISGFSIELLGNINKDSKPDILVGGGTRELSLLRNNGVEGFEQAPGIFTDVSWASAGAVTDLDRDGDLDIVVGSNSGLENEIAVLLRNGDGSFDSPDTFTVGGGSEVSVADFNADGNLDIAAATNDDTVSILLGDGKGNFDPPGQFDVFDVGDNPTGIVVDDFNGDGKPDIATANNDSNDVSVLLNTTAFNPLTVDTLVDENDGDLSPGDVSLREAIAYVSSGGSINFDPSLTGGTITLTEGQLEIDKDLTIKGLGADQLTVSGNNASRVFLIDDGNNNNLIDVEIEGLTISDGRPDTTNKNGGGIRNFEDLTITNSTISDNLGGNFGGGIFNEDPAILTVTNSTISDNQTEGSAGGGVFNSGTLTVTNSTISGNQAANSGGGISNQGLTDPGILTVSNSTISNNTSGFNGGGINTSGGNVTVTNSTISGNQSDNDGGGINSSFAYLTVLNSTITENMAGAGQFSSFSNGGGISSSFSSGTVKSTIIAGNSVDTELADPNPDVSGSFTTTEFNLIGDGTGGTGFTNGVNGNQVGTSDRPIDPLLSILKNNGGPTQTHALLNGSLAIDAAAPLVDIATDQRGVPRPFGSQSDIGAVEALPFPDSGNIVVDTLTDELDSDLSPGDVSLREAIAYSSSGGTIHFDSSLAGGTITLELGALVIDKDLTIDGLGANQLTVSGNNASRVFRVDDGIYNSYPTDPIDVEIRGLTISDGNTMYSGGGVLNRENLTIRQSTISGNFAKNDGGGINNQAGTDNPYASLFVHDSTISGNTAERGGGGITNFEGTTEIHQSTISGNTAPIGGGVHHSYGSNDMTIANSTITGNTASEDRGSGVFNQSSTLVNVVSSIVSGNVNSDIDVDTVEFELPGFSSGGNNLIGTGNGSIAFNATGDQINVTDPGLSSTLILEDGASTPTHALLDGSPAIDAGSNPFGLIYDQRGFGFDRIFGPSADIGAFEVQAEDGILPTPEDDNLMGGPGNDSIDALAGNDTVDGGFGDDTLEGGPGDDLLKGNRDDDLLLGNIGDDRLVGQGGDDTLEGGDGTDTLWGEAGDDSLDGGAGNDRLIGWRGEDTLNGGFGEDTLEGGDGDDLLKGNRDDDLLLGEAGDDRLVGQGGDDTLLGGQGNDRLWGEAGDDSLNGGAGDDFILGWKGDDTIRGGSGRDTFVFAPDHGTDTIADFTVEEDSIGLKDGLTAADLLATPDNGNTKITLGDETLVILENQTLSHSEIDFISL